MSPVVVALDFPTTEQALSLAKRLQGEDCRVKVGKELFTRGGPAFVEQLHGLGHDVFLDLKFHDIPNTVAAAVAAAADLGVWMVNVHASTGPTALTKAADALSQFAAPPLLIAVTVLTSFSQEELEAVAPGESVEARVDRLAQLAQQCGLDGVVCSPFEAASVRDALGADFVRVTPGVRPAGTDSQDQTRIMTPAQAMASGSSYLVIGRPITQASNPVDALRQINLTLQSA